MTASPATPTPLPRAGGYKQIEVARQNPTPLEGAGVASDYGVSVDENSDEAQHSSDLPTTQPSTDAPRKGPPRWALLSVLGLIAGIAIANWIAAVTLSGLLKDHPVLLMMLNPITRNLLLVADRIDPFLFFTLAFIRRMVPHPAWFLIGRWYGERGIAWVKKHSPDIAMMIEWIEERFPRFGWLFCVLYPHPAVCAMAGTSRMTMKAFLIWCSVGIIGFVTAAYFLGDWASPITTPLVNFADRYKWPIMGISLVLMVVSYKLNAAEGRGQFESIDQMEAELEGDAPINSNASQHSVEPNSEPDGK